MSSPWHIFHVRKRTPFYVSVYSHGIAYGKKPVLGFNYRISFLHINGQVTMREAEFQRQRRMVTSRLKRDPQFLLRMIDKSVLFHSALMAVVRRIQKLPLIEISNTVLADWLDRYVTAMATMWTIAVVPLYVEQDLTDEIGRFVASRLVPDEATRPRLRQGFVGQAMQVLMTPKKEGIVGEEYAALLRIALSPKFKQSKAVERHAEQYAWMANQLFTHSFFPLGYYRRRIAALTPARSRILLAGHTREQREHHRAYARFMRQLRPDRRMRTMIDSLNEAIFWRSWRGEKPYETEYLVREFIEEIARRLHLSAKDLLFCLPKEIDAWLRTGKAVAASVIHARKKGFVYLTSKRERVLTGRFVHAWERRVAVKILKDAEVHGTTAFPGIVRGVARVVHGAAELGKVKPKDILITPSTTPLFTPVLHKVQAIITEEGGVLSHASVIARELKIPCIIGTKIATDVFCDGDIINVDAGKGIVRKATP